MFHESFLNASEPLWSPGSDLSWLNAFEVPNIEWAESLLPHFNLPSAIVDGRPALQKLHQQLRETLSQGYDWSRKNQHLGDLGDLDNQVLSYAVQKTFKELAKTLGNSAAREFERWARQHFVNKDIKTALFHWQLLLISLSSSQRLTSSKSLPAAVKNDQPPFLECLWSCLESFMPKGFHSELCDQVATLAPRPTPEHIEQGWIEHPEELVVCEVILQERTISTLNCIASKIDTQQQQILMNWLVAYGDAVWIDIEEPERELQYLSTKPPLWDMPTIV